MHLPDQRVPHAHGVQLPRVQPLHQRREHVHPPPGPQPVHRGEHPAHAQAGQVLHVPGGDRPGSRPGPAHGARRGEQFDFHHPRDHLVRIGHLCGHSGGHVVPEGTQARRRQPEGHGHDGRHQAPCQAHRQREGDEALPDRDPGQEGLRPPGADLRDGARGLHQIGPQGAGLQVVRGEAGGREGQAGRLQGLRDRGEARSGTDPGEAPPRHQRHGQRGLLQRVRLRHARDTQGAVHPAVRHRQDSRMERPQDRGDHHVQQDPPSRVRQHHRAEGLHPSGEEAIACSAIRARER